MKLTPAKVRGKRWAPGDPNKAANRAKKRHENPEEKAERRHRKFLQRKERKKPFRLQNGFAFMRSQKAFLPLELVERIFLLSKNMNFARANLQLGWLLSGRGTLIQVVQAAFAPTWENSWFHRGSPKNLQEDPVFQTSVLKQPWAKFDVLREAYVKWSEQILAQEKNRFCYYHGQILLRPWVDKCPRKHHASRCFMALYASFRQSGASACLKDLAHAPLVHPETEIPSHLITGPWSSWERIDRLFWLMYMRIKIDRDEHWDILLEGCHRTKAMSDPLARSLLSGMLGALEPHRNSSLPWNPGAPLPDLPVPVKMLPDNGPQDMDQFENYSGLACKKAETEAENEA